MKIIMKKSVSATRKKRHHRKHSAKRTHRRRGLSEMSKFNAKEVFTDTLSGAGGGAAGYLIDKMLLSGATITPLIRFGVLMGIGILTGAFLKQHKLSAGMLGYFGASVANELMTPSGTHEGNYARNLNSLPAILDGNGRPVALSEGNEYYLAENGAVYQLQDNGYMPRYR